MDTNVVLAYVRAKSDDSPNKEIIHVLEPVPFLRKLREFLKVTV